MTEIPPAVLKVLDKWAQEQGFKDYNELILSCGGYADAYSLDTFAKLATLAFKAGREFERKKSEVKR